VNSSLPVLNIATRIDAANAIHETVILLVKVNKLFILASCYVILQCYYYYLKKYLFK